MNNNFYIITGVCINGMFHNDGGHIASCTSINNTIQGNTKNNIPIVLPYGLVSVPNDNTMSVLFNSTSNIYGGQPLIIGTINGLNYPFLNLDKGESALYSNKWFLKVSNSAITATKLNDSTVVATLPSGEWTGYMMLKIRLKI